MKTNKVTTRSEKLSLSKHLALAGLIAGSFAAKASTDYPPAVWRAACSSEQYTTGYGHKFCVIHDMEGYYLSSVSLLTACGGVSSSVHYAVNGKQDAASDAAAGEVTQMVRESNYAWHARCWNQHSWGTEHEGFASNPAWYTEAQYQSSADLQRHLCGVAGFAKDRNHIVGHDEKKNAPWVSWANANLGIDATCNTHTDPGAYWDWSHFMNLVNAGGVVNPPYYFDTSTQGWVAGNGSSALAWQNCCGWPGILYGDQTGDDMFWFGPAASVAGGGDASVNVQVYPQSGTTANHQIKVYWKTAAENFFDEAKSSQTVNYTAQNTWYSINLSMNSTKYLGQNINQYRLDFDALNSSTRFIVNHFYTQTTPRYYFDSNAQGWTAGNGICCGIGWTGTGWPGVIFADQNGPDAFFLSPTFNFLGAGNDVVRVRVYPQNGTTANHDAKIYFKTSGDAGFSEAKSTPVINYTAQGVYYNLTFNVGSIPGWAGAFINQLRFDVDSANTGTRWIIDYIMVDHL